MKRAAGIALLALSCCGSPTAPESFAGRWIGTATDHRAGSRHIRFDLQERGGGKFSGTVEVVRAGMFSSVVVSVDGVPLEQARLGTIELDQGALFLTIPGAGGCSPFGPSCDLTAAGNVTINGRTMTGSYACSLCVTDLLIVGTLTLTRQ